MKAALHFEAVRWGEVMIGPDANYCVLDACGAAWVPQLAANRGKGGARCLYAEPAESELWALAPFVFELDKELLEVLQGRSLESWGFIVGWDGVLDELRQHLRRFLVVEDPEGGAWHFRFYDPRVLVPFLQGAEPEERADFLRGVNSILVPHPKDDDALYNLDCRSGE